MTRLVDENGAPRYLIVEFSKTEAEQPAQDCTVQAAAQGEKTKGLRDACKMKGLTKALVFLAVNGIEMEYAQEELIAIILLMASDRADCGALAQ